MFTRPFRFERAQRFADASGLVREHGEDAKVIAGGQSLMPLINLGLVQPSVVIDVSRAVAADDGPDPRGATVADGYLTIGALVTHARLVTDSTVAGAQPLLGAAARRIGNARVRNRGTLGGSLAHSDPAAELPLAMVTLGAQYAVSDGRRDRTIGAGEFHLDFLTTQLQADELVISAAVPALGPGWGWGFQEFARRDGDFAIAMAAALVRSADGVIIESRVGVGGVASRPVRLADVETALSGASAADVPGRIGPIRGIRPVADAGLSAGYRARICRVLVIRAVTEACERSAEAA